MIKDIEKMDAYYLDVFKEIGNIGSSSAATALSKIVEKRVELSLPCVKILDFNEITKILGGEEVQVLGILQPMQGDLTGNIMFILGLREAHDLASLLIRRMLHDKDYDARLGEFSDMELSALREIGNIMICSYISAISSLTQLAITPLVPAMAIDMAAAIMSVLTIEFGKAGDHVLYISSDFLQDNMKIGGDFFLVPDISSYGTLLKSLGVA